MFCTISGNLSQPFVSFFASVVWDSCKSCRSFASLIFLSSSVIVRNGEHGSREFGTGGVGKGGGKETWAAHMYSKCWREDHSAASLLPSTASIVGGTNFFWTAQRNSKTGHKMAHALIEKLDLSNSWNLDDNNRIRIAGTRDFASRMVVKTRGGIHKLFLKRATVGFWSGTVNISKSVPGCMPFRSRNAGTDNSSGIEAEVESTRYTSELFLHHHKGLAPSIHHRKDFLVDN